MEVILCRGNGRLQSSVLSADIQLLTQQLKDSKNKFFSHISYKESALYVAAYFCEKEIIDLLIKNGADINSATIEGNTPLHAAAYVGNADIMKQLLEAGADATLKNAKGLTADDILRESSLKEFESHHEPLETSITTDLLLSGDTSSETQQKFGSILGRLTCRQDKKDTSNKARRSKTVRTKFGVSHL
ncbi:unnamed protein product [Echinostoma caproni]|uniref:ANK_REP_REGION domain-containing protein n=1 Tax=Echinostoma caproni TaxID=27848 RepID=A0A183AYH0_9TREM|nr:unnamed protein product [Echinostoma caproni]